MRFAPLPAMSQMWKSSSLGVGETRRWRLGLLELVVHHAEGEWQVWHEIRPENEQEGRYLLSEPCEIPEKTARNRFAFDSANQLLRLEPAFPDRPIVSYPESSVSVPPRSSTEFVCGIPLTLQLYAGQAGKVAPLLELPLRRLSKTWFGSPLAGLACYSASTRAVLDHLELEANKYRAVCPVRVSNRTRNPLPIERICIHVEHLQLFEGEKYLWTNEVFVTKESDSESSRVTYGSGAPPNDPEAEQILSPRVVPPGNSVLLKTFNQLRSVMGE